MIFRNLSDLYFSLVTERAADPRALPVNPFDRQQPRGLHEPPELVAELAGKDDYYRRAQKQNKKKGRRDSVAFRGLHKFPAEATEREE